MIFNDTTIIIIFIQIYEFEYIVLLICNNGLLRNTDDSRCDIHTYVVCIRQKSIPVDHLSRPRVRVEAEA